jgi:para-aminobenzoate synthetase/4-amino-4-deoxychorismate lyase
LRGRFRETPVVLRAGTPGEVPGVVAAAEAAARGGRWVVGGLSYAAAGAWDAAQHAVRDDTIPAAHFEVYPGDPEPWPEEDAGLPALDWRPDAALAGGRTPESAITEVIEHIAAGDCYQVNLTTRWRAVSPGTDLHDYFTGLVAAQPGGYAVFCAGAGVASVSPELFFARTGDRLVTQPRKGTAPADADPAVLASAKERAENLMIVDLLRNDLGRVCRTGTVRVDRLFEVHRLPTVWQLTSTVSGRALPGATLAEVFAALFPCGSVTGAPKLAAMRVIAELEAGPRGWYCGAFGVIRPGGDAIFNVPIRTVTASGDGLACGVGSGIVSDSDPAGEVAEWRAKARFLGGLPLAGLETMLLADGRVQRRTAHLDRLAATCAAHRLPFVRGEAEALLDREAASTPHGRHRLRLVAGVDGCHLEVGPAPAAGAPMRLRLAGEPLDADGPLGPVIRHKTTHRAHYDRLRRAAGADVDDVICHNARGELTECTLGNLALLVDGEWCTPAASAGLLPGTLRAELLASGRLRERRLLVGDLDRAQGVAFLNSLRGWCPARLA